jgi:hypothetical protein
MPGSITLPKDARETFQKLASADDEQYKRLSDFIAALPREKVLSTTLERLLAKQKAQDRPFINATMRQLASMAQTAELADVKQDDIIAIAVEQALQGSDDAKLRDSLRDRLNSLLGDAWIDIHFRAWRLLFDEERCLLDSRIISDARPIFDASGEKIQAFILINHLRLHFLHGESEHSSVVLALDENDIDSLRNATRRAKRKMKALRKFLEKRAHGDDGK